MPKIHREALLPYSHKDMYRLVNDVASYSEFLPWCAGTEILELTESRMRATIIVKKMGVSKQFSTENELMIDRKIIVNLLDGPFNYLKGEWQFHPIENVGCKIVLDLDFEVSAGLFSLPFKKIFEPAADSMLHAFVKRAQDVYGK